MRNNYEEIKDWIINKVIEMTLGCNYIVDFEDVSEEFGELDVVDVFVLNKMLSDDCRVADSIINEDGFDVIIYEDYL